MSLMQTLQGILKDATGPQGLGSSGEGGILESLTGKMKDSSNILGPAALGGLLGVLISSKTARLGTGGALLAGGGALLWSKYKERMAQKTAESQPASSVSPSVHSVRAERIIRALVFAAKSDGHIDSDEEKNILREVGKLNLGVDAETLVKQFLSDPLDPELLARGVDSPEEALELYVLSCSVITIDSFMERNYLDALAKALHIPDDVKEDLEKSLSRSA